MSTGGDDRLPFGMRAGVNQNPLQPSFRDGPRQAPRRLWSIGLTVAVALLCVAVLIGYGVVR
jgi:hypothetical protein